MRVGPVGIHVCHPGSCDGAPYRLYVHTRRGSWIIALWPGAETQVYDRRTKRYTDRWSYVVWHPHED